MDYKDNHAHTVRNGENIRRITFNYRGLAYDRIAILIKMMQKVYWKDVHDTVLSEKVIKKNKFGIIPF